MVEGMCDELGEADEEGLICNRRDAALSHCCLYR